MKPTHLETNAPDSRLATQKYVDDAIRRSVVPGSLHHFARSTAPEGYLVCNGEAVSRRTYEDLFEAIGTCFGEGDGETTFNLPDCRGEFIRGWDQERGIDAGRALGSTQDQEIQSHEHDAFSENAGGHDHSGLTHQSGEHAHALGAAFRGGGGPSGSDLNSYYGQDAWTHPNGLHQHGINHDGVHQHPIKVQAAGGNETRPRNIAMLICIKH